MHSAFLGTVKLRQLAVFVVVVVYCLWSRQHAECISEMDLSRQIDVVVVISWLLNSVLTTSRKSAVMIATLLYVFGSRERRSKHTEEMYIPLRPIPKEDCLRRRRFCEPGNEQIIVRPKYLMQGR